MSELETLEADAKAELAKVENFLTTEESKVASFLKPIISEIVSAGKADLLQDIVVDAPSIVAAEVSGGPAAALTAGIAQVTTQLEAQGKALSQQAITTLGAAVVAQAKAVQGSSVSGTASSASGAASGTAAPTV